MSAPIKKSILIIGEESFLGKHVVKKVKKTGYRVVTSSRDTHSLTGTEHIQLDLTKPDFSFLEKDSFDTIIHLAAISIPRMCEENPELAEQVNVTALKELLEIATKLKTLKNFIYPSSVTLVENGQKIINEKSRLDPNKNIYTKTKYAAEQLLRTAIKKENFPATIFRFPNIYGPGQPMGKYANFIPQIIEQALKENKIEIWNTTTIRDWVFIEDILDLFLKTLDAVTCGIYQIGSGYGTSTGEISKMVATLADVPIICLNKEGVGPKYIITDPSKIKNATGWKANTPIAEGLEQTFKYYQSHL